MNGFSSKPGFALEDGIGSGMDPSCHELSHFWRGTWEGDPHPKSPGFALEAHLSWWSPCCWNDVHHFHGFNFCDHSQLQEVSTTTHCGHGSKRGITEPEIGCSSLFKHPKQDVKRLELYRHIPALNANPIPLFHGFAHKNILFWWNCPSSQVPDPPTWRRFSTRGAYLHRHGRQCGPWRYRPVAASVPWSSCMENKGVRSSHHDGESFWWLY